MTTKTKRIKVIVTKECIKRGGRGSHCCPVHLALEQVGLDFPVGATAVYSTDGQSQLIGLPRSAKEFIRKYDEDYYYSSQNLEPFNFYLQVPRFLWGCIK